MDSLVSWRMGSFIGVEVSEDAYINYTFHLFLTLSCIDSSYYHSSEHMSISVTYRLPKRFSNTIDLTFYWQDSGINLANFCRCDKKTLSKSTPQAVSNHSSGNTLF